MEANVPERQPSATSERITELKRALGVHADLLVQHILDEHPDYSFEDVATAAYSCIPVDPARVYSQAELAQQACELYLRRRGAPSPKAGEAQS